MMFSINQMFAAFTLIACTAIGITGGLLSGLAGFLIGALLSYRILEG